MSTTTEEKTKVKAKNKHKVKDIGVDAGLILIADLDFWLELEKSYKLKLNESRDQNLEQIVQLPKGLKKIKWSIKNTWNGSIEGIDELNITSGSVMIGDPCYLFADQNDWIIFLEKFELFDRRKTVKRPFVL